MKPILQGDQNSALFAHQHVATHLPIILDLLARSKVVSEVDISDNSLSSEVIKYLVTFVNESDQLSLLHLDDNPLIGATGMRQLIDGIKDCRSLESLSIANTGCNPTVGKALGQLVIGCGQLLRLNLSNCRLRQSAIDIAQALPQTATLKRLNLSKNELYYGQRRLAVQIGSNVAKCATLSRLDLSQNALTTEMAIALLRGLGDAPALHRLDISKNEIGEPAGRAIANFIAKSQSLRKLDISQNALLNVTVNKLMGQK
jgi:Ran GTPase-activating protein (RanGAP) involved in mRNA processing and transport